MLRVLSLVYLLSLAQGLVLVALDRAFGFGEKRTGAPAELPAIELAGAEGAFARFPVLWIAAASLVLDLLHRRIR